MNTRWHPEAAPHLFRAAEIHLGRALDRYQQRSGRGQVGTDYDDGVKITNTSGRTLQVVVEAGLPDDFGFGLMPGSTCPVFTPGELMADGASCRAVVRFTPTEFFAGWKRIGSMTVTATDPETGAVNVIEIPVTGTGRN